MNPSRCARFEREFTCFSVNSLSFFCALCDAAKASCCRAALIGAISSDQVLDHAALGDFKAPPNAEAPLAYGYVEIGLLDYLLTDTLDRRVFPDTTEDDLYLV